jgi:hypothetical protein
MLCKTILSNIINLEDEYEGTRLPLYVTCDFLTTEYCVLLTSNITFPRVRIEILQGELHGKISQRKICEKFT